MHHSKSSKAILAYLLYDKCVRSLQLSIMIVRLHAIYNSEFNYIRKYWCQRTSVTFYHHEFNIHLTEMQQKIISSSEMNTYILERCINEKNIIMYPPIKVACLLFILGLH